MREKTINLIFYLLFLVLYFIGIIKDNYDLIYIALLFVIAYEIINVKRILKK